MTSKVGREAYLGDGVNITWTGNEFILTQEVQDQEEQTIVIQIDTWLALTRFVKSLEDQR